MGSTHVCTPCNFTMKLETWLLNVWYGDNRFGTYLLLPLSGLFCISSAIRRWRHKRQAIHHPVPVIVVGNISVGGTGKTPLVIWLVEQLRQAGFNPGVISRGYGGQGMCRKVSVDAHPLQVGDEPLLIAQRTQAPVFIGQARNQSIQQLLQQYPCDIIISDDGLQHYRMGRDLEIAVIDGQRRFGNGFCLPAGPLREPTARLAQCDFVITNGWDMQMQGDKLLNLAGQTTLKLHDLAGQKAHAVTGIGNPQRFLQTLKQAGLQIFEHIYPDHHAFTGEEFHFADDLPILMTEKDAVKCRGFATANMWYLPVSTALGPTLQEALLARIKTLKKD